MKKFTLFLFASLFSALSFAALNPYAYGLSSSLDGTTLTVNYSLNALANTVNVVIMDGETEVKTIACDGKTAKGSHTIEISTLDLPTGKSLTWKVVVKGTSVGKPTLQSDLTLKYCLPRGIGVDRSTESPYFGRIYTTDATGGAAYHASEGKGLYVFDAGLTPVTNSTGGKKFTGGITFGTDDISRVVVSDDGRVFLSRFNTTGSPVFEINPANLNESFTPVFTSITGSAIGIDVKGAGENLQLVMLSKTSRVITEYDLKTASQWTSSSPSRTYTKKDLTTENVLSLVTDNAYISYDLNDGVWLTQHRATATTTEPTIAHVIPSGVDYNNYNEGLSHNNTSNGGVAVSPDGKQLAVVGAGTQKLTIYTISRASDGKIKLENPQVITAPSGATNHTALEWDYAGNLYVANRSAEIVTFYAMPYSGTVSTPCASKYAFELEEVETYTITARAADNTMGYVTGGAADIYVGTNISLKATAKTGYYFTQWNDGNTDNPRAITVTGDAEYIAEFAQAYPRVYAYDLNVADNGDSYTFSFKPNTNAVSGNLLLYNEDGTAVVQTHAIPTAIVAHTATSITLNKTDLPNQADVPWAIQLSGNAIPAFAETFADADYRFAKGHAAVDNSPESEYFGRIYVADRRSTKSKSGFYVYNIDFTPLNTEANKLGMDKAGYSRPAVGADGTVYLTGYTDDESGIFVVDPADLTKCTQFYDGARAGSGLFTNGGAELGSSTSGVGVYGEGKNAVLYSMMEDGTGANANSGKQPIVKYQIGQEDGIVLKQWSTAPTWHINYPATGKDSYNFGNNAFAATEKGVWISQNKSNDADRPEIAFIDKEGGVQFMQNLNKSQGAGLAVNADNTVLYLQKAGEILEYNITWTGNKPALTLAKTYPVSLQYITTLSLDYAGNLIACAGTQYGNNTDNNVMKLVAYTLPTDNNTCTVPAAKAKALKLGVRYNVEVLVNNNTMGRATGGGDYKEGETATLIATPAANHRFVNWTKGEEIVSTEATYSFVVTEDVTLTANFEAIPQYTISVSANDGEMGSVTGGGNYYEGSTATLTATPVGGYVFEKWSDDNTDNPRTITVSEAATYTAIFKLAPARVFAYDLDVVDNGNDTYTLSFIPNTNAVSGRVILYNGDTKAQIHEESIAGAIVKGVKSEVVISRSSLPATGNVTWAVELTGEQVEKLTLLTKANDQANYGFNRPQGVAIDNNPASDFFGRIYIALPKAGGTGYSDTNCGIVVMDPQHNRLKSGVVANGDALGANGRYSMHRVAVNPTNGHVYYVRTSDSSEGVTGTAIYELTPDATNILTDGGIAKNVISGASDITNANSVCFDETGAMYVMANANYTNEAGSTGRVYKVIDGVATLFTPNSIEIASKDNAIVPDGKGGFWVAQHRNSLDGSNHLFHINTSGVTDYYIDQNNNASLLPIQTYTKSGTTYKNASYRGQVAYYSIDENYGLVAYGGGAKVSVFKATYDGSGVPTLESWQTISLLSSSSTEGINVDGIAFDYAGNIIVMSATDERMYQYALPIESANTSLVPSPTSKTIKLGTLYNVEVAVNDNAMGTATGAGEYLEGETATVTATANIGYRFLNWTNAGVEVSTNKTYSFTVTESVTLTANFAPLPEIAYELNGGQWNKYGWTSKKDMYNALLDDWRAYSGSTRTNKSYEEQLGVGNSSKGIPTTVYSTDDRVALWNLFTDPTYASKWGWLATYVDAVAATQYNKMVAANGVKTQPTSAAGVFTFTIGNFFGEDNAHSTDYIDAVDFTGAEAQPQAFQPTWGQSLPMPTHPTTEMVLPNPVREDYEFAGWYAAADFSGVEVTTIDENTNGTLYAKWTQNLYTRPVTGGEYGTICLPYAANKYAGAEFYEIAYLELANDGVTPKTIWLDEVEGALEAGKPYIFRATSSQIRVICIGDEVLSPVEGKAGLTGTFTGITDESVLEGNYMIAQNKFWLCGTGCWLNANRAYIDKIELHNNTTPVSPMPGRRRVSMGAAGENTATGVDNISDEGVTQINRTGTYDVLGRKVSEPTGTGFYIIDGKKVFVIK